MNTYVRKGIAVMLLGGMAFAQTASSTPKKKPAAKKAVAVTAEDIQQLRQMLEQQQQQIQQMQQQMSARDQQLQQTQQQLAEAQAAARDAQTKVVAVEGTANETKQGFVQVQNDVNDIKGNMTSAALQTQEDQKKVQELAGILGKFNWSGDVRVRYENFFQQGTQDRNRERIRLRFGFTSKLNDDFSAGVFMASGAITDPTSTNETLTNVFERKTISFDRGYIVYNPQKFKPLTLTGGKFAYTWNRTPVTFDSDLNPEGFSEKFSLDVKNSMLKNVTFTAMQLLYNEAGSGPDSYAVGGQVSGKLQIGSRWTMIPSYGLLNWHNNNVILNEPASVTGGTATGPFAPNGMTNCTVTVAGVRSFCSQFLYSDLIINNTIKTPIAKLPFNLLAEYLVNLNANINQKHAYYVDASLGQTKNKGDIQFGYAFIRQEQDSVIASFNESDQRAPTNSVNHRVMFNWKLQKNTVFGYTQWFGRTLDSNLVNARLAPGVTPGTTEPLLKRGQFDVIYSF